MTTETIANTRAAARDHLLERVRQAAAERLTAIEGGPLDGIEVLSAGTLDEVLGAVRAEELPPLDLHTAEVLSDSTPALVLVWAACPRCGIRQLLSAEISPRLVVEASAELSLRARSKARSHVCGQLPLKVGPEADGQASFELEDIIGEEAGVEAEAEPVGDPCPFPGCALEAEHAGDHEIPGPDEP